jgi:hypothetical protein
MNFKKYIKSLEEKINARDTTRADVLKIEGILRKFRMHIEWASLWSDGTGEIIGFIERD